MAFFIKKKIDLEFLGEEYKGCYFVFKNIPVSEYDEIFKKKKDTTGLQVVNEALKVLKSKFIEGKFINENGELADVKADDLGFLDESLLNECYLTLLGQKTDPK